MTDNEITVNGIVYVKKEEITKKKDGAIAAIFRGDRSGVFFGYYKKEERDGIEVTIYEARRLWSWKGAASLSQLAMEGVKDKTGSKFPRSVTEILMLDCIEIIPVTTECVSNLNSVPVWEK